MVEQYLENLYASRKEPTRQPFSKQLINQKVQNNNRVICEQHKEVYNGICTICSHILDRQELLDYRQFALLNHQQVQVHSTFGKEQVQKKRDQIIQERKLVLVLDLDHTLLHSKTLEVKDLHVRSRDKEYIALVDELKSVYEVKLYGIAFHVKLRTYLGQFLKQLCVEQKYDVHYYTAGTRSYGLMIIDLIKLEIKRLFEQNEPQMVERMNSILSHDKLIGRDDKERYEDKASEQKMQEQFLNSLEKSAFGGDSTLNLKNFCKSLSSLAGGDDSIFVIIDDRFDVWLEESKDSNGNSVKKISDNLLQIPAYFYWEQPENLQLDSYKKLILNIARVYDLDLSLMFHLKFLERVHTNFYKEIDAIGNSDVKPIVRQCRKSIFDSTKVALFDILFKGDHHMDIKKLQKTYEGNKCMQYGLEFSDSLAGDKDKEYLYLVPDCLSSEQRKEIEQIKNGIQGLDIKFVSIYWLYFSCYYYVQLPLEPFMILNQQRQGEDKRIRELLLNTLQLSNITAYTEYQERWKKMCDRKEASLLKKRLQSEQQAQRDQIMKESQEEEKKVDQEEESKNEIESSFKRQKVNEIADEVEQKVDNAQNSEKEDAGKEAEEKSAIII